MVIINEEIENVLLDIYSIEFARNVNTPNYYALKAQLFALDKRYINRVPGRYPAWKRMGWFEFVYKQHIFGYSWDGDNVVLQDYYSLKGNRNENKFYQYNILESRNLNNVMKNKQIIRLTESDLHNMIAEAVKVALNEMDFQGYRQAKKKHPNLMNKVDPRTFANRARGMNAQGKERNDDKAAMQHAARTAWNNEFGTNDTKIYDHDNVDQDSMGMFGNHGGMGAYNIDRQLGKFRSGEKISNGNSAVYNPSTNKTYQANKSWESEDGVGIDIPQRGLNIAKQMAKGNGKYSPNSGWR